MQKPTLNQQRILNAMNSGAVLIWERIEAKLKLYGPGPSVKTIAGNQAFNMKRKGLIEEMVICDASITYCRTQEAMWWCREQSIAAGIK